MWRSHLRKAVNCSAVQTSSSGASAFTCFAVGALTTRVRRAAFWRTYPSSTAASRIEPITTWVLRTVFADNGAPPRPPSRSSRR
ncbi:hypothetical protein ACFPRL_27570 [Pseudoclavibacter helvolus]